MAAYTSSRPTTDPTFVYGRVSSAWTVGVGVIHGPASLLPGSPMTPSLPARTTYPYSQPTLTTFPRTP